MDEFSDKEFSGTGEILSKLSANEDMKMFEF